MIVYRSFVNTDATALTELWNRCLTARPVTGPLSVHDFDALVPGKLHFDRHGLIVAEEEDEGQIVGFAHAGFGPLEPRGRTHQLDFALGTIAMMVLDPRVADSDVPLELLRAGESYLRRKGARVIYAGGQYPLNPYYWGLYGGSEFAGILDGHGSFLNAVRRAGFEVAAEAEVLEADLAGPEPRDPRITLLRRQYRIDIEEDAMLPGWWDSLALGLFRPTRYQVVDRLTGVVPAHAWTWDIATGLAIEDSIMRTGLVALEVQPEFRRRGLARYLVQECWKNSRAQLVDRLCVQTLKSNIPAIRLYASLGFKLVTHTTLFRLPGDKTLLGTS